MSEQNHYIYEFGPFRLDARKRRLLRGGEVVPLTSKTFDTLLALVEGCGRVLKKDELLERVWPDAAVEEGNLALNISNLRKALGDNRRRPEYIVTIHGEGYQFVAGVRGTFDEVVYRESTSITVEEEEEADGAVADGELQAADSPGEAGALAHPSDVGPPLLRDEGQPSYGPPSPTRRPRPSRRGVALFAAALSVVGAATAYGVYEFVSQRPAGGGAAAVPSREMSISRVTTSGKITHAAISPDGKYVAHVTQDAEGDSLWVRHVAAPSGVRVAGPAAAEYVSVTFAPDGDSVYYLTLGLDKGHTALYRVPVLGGPSSAAAHDVGPVGFSPDGRQIAFIRAYNSESRLIVAGADGANERVLAERRQPEFFRVDWNAPAWSPDGKTIACQARLSDERGQYETVVGVGVADGSQTPLTSVRWNYTGQPVWLAGGGGLLMTANESATDPVQVWRVAPPGGEVARVTQDLNDYHDLSLTADGSRLAAVQDNAVSGIWVAPGGDAGRAKQVASEVGWIQELALTPDGRIVYRSNAGGSAELWAINADGSNPKQLTAGAGVSRGLAVSPTAVTSSSPPPARGIPTSGAWTPTARTSSD
ncbi:MAG: winged helix-turn-helix domain-containing protein [Acidobacteria bacterium]|nr:winged helix-turn-helix domain-containing protein [Acidobacteriota bacterium]MCA1621499.1 winged helix-turn-helix domain-containing protein [Acidobacteriota bacterium]